MSSNHIVAGQPAPPSLVRDENIDSVLKTQAFVPQPCRACPRTEGAGWMISDGSFILSGDQGLNVLSARAGLLADILLALLLSPHRNVRLGSMLQERLLDPESVVPQVLVSFAEITGRCGSAYCKNPESGIDQNSHFCAPRIMSVTAVQKDSHKGPAIGGGTETSRQSKLPLLVFALLSRVRRRYPVNRIARMMNVPTARTSSMMISSGRFMSVPSHFKQYEIKRAVQSTLFSRYSRAE